MQLGYQPKIVEADLYSRCLTPKMRDFLRTIAQIQTSMFDATAMRIRKRRPYIENAVAILANEAQICGWIEVVTSPKESEPIHRLTQAGWETSGEKRPPFLD